LDSHPTRLGDIKGGSPWLVSILPPGQSEDPKSAHFGDQREMAGYWKFKPMLYTKELLELEAKQGK